MRDLIGAILAIASSALVVWMAVVVYQLAVYGPHCAPVGGGCG